MSLISLTNKKNKISIQSNLLTKTSYTLSNSQSNSLINNVDGTTRNYSNQNSHEAIEFQDCIFDTSNNLVNQASPETGVLVDKTIDNLSVIIKNQISLNQRRIIAKDNIQQSNELVKINSVSQFLNNESEISSSANANIEVAERILSSKTLFPITTNSTFSGFSLNGQSLDLKSVEGSRNKTITNISKANVTQTLNVPEISENNNTELQDSFCGNIDSNKDVGDTACKTWFDYENSLNECDCSNTGMVINIMAAINAELNRKHQFPEIEFDLCKIYNYNYYID